MSKKKNKIVIVANSAWNILNFRIDLLTELKAEGYKPVILSPEGPETLKLKEKGFEVHRLKFLKRKGTNPLSDLFFYLELLRYFNRIRPELVLLYTAKPNIYGSTAASLLKIKSIATVTGLGYPFISKSLVGSAIKKLYKQAFKRTDIVVFHNEDDRALFMNKAWVNDKKSRVIFGSGINLSRFKPDVSTKMVNGCIRFLFIGRLLYDKGIGELMEAFKMISLKHKNIELQLVGSIDDDNPTAIHKKQLDTWLNESKNCTHINGTEDVIPFLNAADVVVLPSYREGLPKTILEALAMAKPVIVSDVPGCRETVLKSSKSNGLLCKAKDALSLAESMEKMISFTEIQRKEMGSLSRNLAFRRFDKEIINEQYLELIRQLINK